MLNSGFFSSLKGTPKNPKPATGVTWWIGAALMFLIPTVTYFPLTYFANLKIPTTWFFPQQISTNILFWLLVNALISLILFCVWHVVANKKKGGTIVSYGLKGSAGFAWKKLGLSAWFSFLVIAAAYLAVLTVAYFFTVDFRFWVIPLKQMSLTQFKIALRYILPFALYYLMFAVVLHGQMRFPKASFAKRMIMSAVLSASGYLVLLLVLYVPLLIIGMVPIPLSVTLYMIVAIQLLPLFILVSLVSTYFYEKTGLVYTGAFINAMFITWYIVASEATQFPVL
jgi:hypothetical protein